MSWPQVMVYLVPHALVKSPSVPAFALEHVIVVKLAGLGAFVQVPVDAAAALVEVLDDVGVVACTRLAAKLV